MGRRSNTDERRDQIVDGLLRVMAERGYERASIASIAEAAGLTPGLVHYHFRSKQEVLVALVDHLATLLRARFEDRLGHGTDGPHHRLQAFLDAHVALGKGADPAAVACWVAVGAEAVRQKEVAEVYGRAVEERLGVLTSLLRDVLMAEKRETAQARAHAAALLAAIEGMFQLSVSVPTVLPRGFAAAAIVDMARGLVGSTPFTREAP